MGSVGGEKVNGWETVVDGVSMVGVEGRCWGVGALEGD